jgi:chemotaxis protein MotB
MSTQQTPPIIVMVKKKGGHAAHHGGAWKVAYADFVTAMMALFIVLWLLNSGEKVKQAIAGYFKDPAGTGKLMGTNMNGKGDSVVVKPENMDQLKDQIQQEMNKLPKFEQLKNNVEMTVTTEGLRIELLETEKGMFFDSGSSKISASGEDVLKLLADQLKQLPNKLLIEGHTDAKPYTSPNGYTNWELSADRANTARRVFMECGVGQEQVAQVRGFADRQLRKRDDPLNPSNRRVSVIVQYTVPPGGIKPAEMPGLAGQAPTAPPTAAGAAQAAPSAKTAPGA